MKIRLKKLGPYAAAIFVLGFLLIVGIRFFFLPRWQKILPDPLVTSGVFGAAQTEQEIGDLKIFFRPMRAREIVGTSLHPFLRFASLPPFDWTFEKPDQVLDMEKIFIPEEVVERGRSAISHLPDGRPLQVYFGNLHTHTGWSDGVGDPYAAFAEGRDVARLDFLGVTDHPEFWIIGTKERWQELEHIEKFYSGKNFVALRGFEYSSPVFGHYTVINSRGVCSSFKCSKLEDFYGWLESKEGSQALAIFSHPFHQKHNASRFEFADFGLRKSLIDRMIGIEVSHWDGYRQFLSGLTGKRAFFDDATQKGWRLGAVAAQDTHNANWGHSGVNRLALLLPELSREEVIKALQARRFYGTSSPHIQFVMEARVGNGAWQAMGASIDWNEVMRGADLEVRVRFAEPDSLRMPRILEVVFNGEAIGVRPVNQTTELKLCQEKDGAYAGEFYFTLARRFFVRDKMNYFYVRFYQDDQLDSFTQASPIFVVGPGFQLPKDGV